MKKVLWICAAFLVVACVAMGIVLFMNKPDDDLSSIEPGVKREVDSRHSGGKIEPTKVITPKAKKTKLSMWCIATEVDANRPAYEEAIKDLELIYPDVEFEWEAFENEAYKYKIKAAVAANEMPDIFFAWSGAFLEDFVKADRVYCLDEAYKLFANDLPEKMCKNTTYEGKKYGVPLNMNIVALFANRELLSQVGYSKVPATYEELIDCCDKLLANGIIPFGCAGRETWCVTEYLESIIEKNIGADALHDVFIGRASWNNKGIAEAIDIFQNMIEKGYFGSDGMLLSNDEVKSNFMAGRYAFYMNGTWFCADFSWSDDLKDKIVISEFPLINSNVASLGQYVGGPSDTLAVAKSSKNAELAALYAFRLGQLISKYAYLDGVGIPAWNIDYDDSNINPLTKAAAKFVAESNGMVLFGDTIQNSENAMAYLEQVDKVYYGGISGEEFIDTLSKQLDSADFQIDRDLKGLEVSIVDWWSGEVWAEPHNAYEEAYWDMMNDAFVQYNFTLNRVNSGYDWVNYPEKMMLSITNNNPKGQIISFEPEWISAMLASGLFLDVSKLQSINWSDEKFNQTAIKAMTVGDAIYGFASGFEPQTGVFFNKDIFERLGVDPSLPYDLQATDRWNFAEFSKLCAKLTKDTNNDGKTDIYGVTGQDTIVYTSALYANGTDIVLKDADGMLVANSKDAKVMEALQWARSLYDNGYAVPKKNNDSWDFFKEAFGDERAAMYIEDAYAISNFQWWGLENVGFVSFPYGPSSGAPVSICKEVIYVIPACECTADIAEDIAFAYDIFASVPQGWENDDTRWKPSFVEDFEDERAVDETLNLLVNRYSSVMGNTYLIPGFAPNWLYELGDGQDIIEVLEKYEYEWQEQFDEFNEKMR